MNIGQKEKLKEFMMLDKDKLKEELSKECLAVAYVMITEGKTRQADEAIRVYKRLQDK